jgi:hypothetical protein
LINQVIKRQQEILQIIIGCNCSEASTTTTTAAPDTTTVAPAFARGDYDEAYDLDKVSFVEQKIPVVEGVIPKKPIITRPPK